MVGESIGNVMFQNLRRRPAPSICAASCRCSGMPCSPARKITAPLPNPHNRIKTSAGLAQASSKSQLGAGKPTARSATLMMPERGLSSHSHSMAVAAPASTEGR